MDHLGATDERRHAVLSALWGYGPLVLATAVTVFASSRMFTVDGSWALLWGFLLIGSGIGALVRHRLAFWLLLIPTWVSVRAAWNIAPGQFGDRGVPQVELLLMALILPMLLGLPSVAAGIAAGRWLERAGGGIITRDRPAGRGPAR